MERGQTNIRDRKRKEDREGGGGDTEKESRKTGWEKSGENQERGAR